MLRIVKLLRSEVTLKVTGHITSHCATHNASQRQLRRFTCRSAAVHTQKSEIITYPTLHDPLKNNSLSAYGDNDTIGLWGQRHLRYIKQNRKVIYLNLLTSGKLNGYLADLDKQAEDMFFRLVKQMAKCEGVTEQLKADNQMAWIARMNNIRSRATEIVNNDLIYTF